VSPSECESEAIVQQLPHGQLTHLYHLFHTEFPRFLKSLGFFPDFSVLEKFWRINFILEKPGD